MRRFDLEGLRRSLKSLVTDEDPRGQNVSLQFIPLDVFAQQRPHSD